MLGSDRPAEPLNIRVDNGVNCLFVRKAESGIKPWFDAHVVVKVAVAEVPENARGDPGKAISKLCRAFGDEGNKGGSGHTDVVFHVTPGLFVR